jgi:hypothetical protein
MFEVSYLSIVIRKTLPSYPHLVWYCFREDGGNGQEKCLNKMCDGGMNIAVQK